jgi:hypothetical protein
MMETITIAGATDELLLFKEQEEEEEIRLVAIRSYIAFNDRCTNCSENIRDEDVGTEQLDNGRD